MKTNTILICVLLFSACLSWTSNLGQNAGQNFSANNMDCRKIKYLIVNNSLLSSNTRRIDVFMDPDGFSKNQLQQLFSLLSREFNDPEVLVIRVKTDWSQTEFYRNCPTQASSGPDDGINGIETPTGDERATNAYENFDFNWAKFSRRGSDIYFEYTSDLTNKKKERVYMVLSNAKSSE